MQKSWQTFVKLGTKSEQADIAADEIRSIIAEYQQRAVEAAIEEQEES